MTRGLFIAGTDTGVGKTVVATALLRRAALRGLTACGMKPVAAGLPAGGGAADNDDVARLIAAANRDAPLELICPYPLEAAASPHIAAALQGVVVEPRRIAECFAALAARVDCVIAEGAGGWHAPIGPGLTMADIARALALPVVLVVGLRLGCLSHAMLTVRAVQADGLRLAGWVANTIDREMPYREENLGYLEAHIPAPLLGMVPSLADDDPMQAVEALTGADRLLHG